MDNHFGGAQKIAQPLGNVGKLLFIGKESVIQPREFFALLPASAVRVNVGMKFIANNRTPAVIGDTPHFHQSISFNRRQSGRFSIQKKFVSQLLPRTFKIP